MSGATEKLPLKFSAAETVFTVAATGATPPPAAGERVWRLEKVPSWWYAETVCGLTKASFWWWSNVVCAVFHFGLAMATVAVSTADGRSFATPTLTVYVTKLTWQANSTDALVPVFEKAETPLYLSTMTMMFFLLSFLAHGLIVVGNWKQAFAAKNLDWRRTTGWSGWYFVHLHQCRQPLRYTPRPETLELARFLMPCSWHLVLSGGLSIRSARP
tara:strand:- start:1350 stop:1994 length:645 start_codon:yes stop_codon:yes gene_type:complete